MFGEGGSQGSAYYPAAEGRRGLGCADCDEENEVSNDSIGKILPQKKKVK